MLLSKRLSLPEVKGACHVAYGGTKGERYRFPDDSVWEIADAWATRMSGFKAVLLRPGGARILVLSFAGTDSVRDFVADAAQVLGVLPIQYVQARVIASRLNSMFPDRLYLTGHSLGGGLAAYCSVALRLPASTINPAPLVAAATFSAWLSNNSQITNYIAGGREIVSSSPGRIPGQGQRVEARGNFITRHYLDNVAPQTPLPAKI